MDDLGLDVFDQAGTDRSPAGELGGVLEAGMPAPVSGASGGPSSSVPRLSVTQQTPAVATDRFSADT